MSSRNVVSIETPNSPRHRPKLSKDFSSPRYAVPPTPLEGLEQLTALVADFRAALTESTEQTLRLRHALGGLLEDLRMTGRSAAQHRAACVPRLVVAGARQSGRSAVARFVLQRPAEAPPTRRPPPTRSAAPDGTRRRGSRRRLTRGEDEAPPRSGPSFKFVTVLPFPDWRPEEEVAAGRAPVAVTILPGGFDWTVMDRIGAGAAPRETRRADTMPYALNGCVEGHRAASWILHEGGEGLLWRHASERAEVEVPDSLCGEAIFFTVPCDAVGTQRLGGDVAELFGHFVETNAGERGSNSSSPVRVSITTTHVDTASPSTEKSVDLEEDLRIIRQLISDITFYVLTFSDLITARVDGITFVDDELNHRPPPMARSLRELVELFINQMRTLFGVEIAPWQVIPFSGSVSSLTWDLLVAAFDSRSRFDHLGNGNTSEFLSSSLDEVPDPFNVSGESLDSSSQTLRPPSIHVALQMYCDTVFGKNFQNQQGSIEMEQVKKMALDYAITNTWFTSGAHQVMRTVSSFEWSTLQHYLSRVAASVVMWSRQLRLALPKARQILRGRLRGVRTELRRVRQQEQLADKALERLKTSVIPSKFAKDLQVRLHHRFEDFSLRFCYRLYDLLNDKTFETPIFLGAPPIKRKLYHEAQRRLLSQKRIFIKFYVTGTFEQQMEQLLRIIAEEKGMSFSYPKNVRRRSKNFNTESKECKRATALQSAASPSPSLSHTPALDHIPFVADNVHELKATMERELTLQLARLNTEIINCFMAELDAALPEFVNFYMHQRDAVAAKMDKALQPLLDAQGPEVVLENHKVALAWHNFTQLSLLQMQSAEQLESFVTGLRAALCEDQILLILHHRETGVRIRSGTVCAKRTLAYLERAECRGGEGVHSFYQQEKEQKRLAESRKPLKEFWASSVEEVFLRRRPSRPTKVADPLADDSPPNPAVDGDGAALFDLWPDTDCGPKDLLWYLRAVWREVLGAMSFRPWLLLDGVQYAYGLNSFCAAFLSKHERLHAEVKGDLRGMEATMREMRREGQRLEVHLPAALQRISATAISIAEVMKESRSEMCATAILPERF